MNVNEYLADPVLHGGRAVDTTWALRTQKNQYCGWGFVWNKTWKLNY